MAVNRDSVFFLWIEWIDKGFTVGRALEIDFFGGHSAFFILTHGGGTVNGKQIFGVYTCEFFPSIWNPQTKQFRAGWESGKIKILIKAFENFIFGLEIEIRKSIDNIGLTIF